MTLVPELIREEKLGGGELNEVGIAGDFIGGGCGGLCWAVGIGGERGARVNPRELDGFLEGGAACLGFGTGIDAVGANRNNSVVKAPGVGVMLDLPEDESFGVRFGDVGGLGVEHRVLVEIVGANRVDAVLASRSAWTRSRQARGVMDRPGFGSRKSGVDSVGVGSVGIGSVGVGLSVGSVGVGSVGVGSVGAGSSVGSVGVGSVGVVVAMTWVTGVVRCVEA
ncbi:hypothetical protein BC938DRAFT_480874 [Jimgerdemannia flammicorona]|uniref:Uncharacterized protein n=1 Tax=Jimgerdemannia flammicorona TaxID=994334 RepID=A0A433QHE1_9FUNG|nr:hypothetical protein BC938DRAFT_480874 [Jimgerdemannia flammicorona]